MRNATLSPGSLPAPPTFTPAAKSEKSSELNGKIEIARLPRFLQGRSLALEF